MSAVLRQGSQIHGQQLSNHFGELLEGKYSDCLKCHQCYVGLWSCIIQVKNQYDITLLNKIAEDIDSNLLPKSGDSKESLISRIPSSTYLDDIASTIQYIQY
jgi:hypothetical protein